MSLETQMAAALMPQATDNDLQRRLRAEAGVQMSRGNAPLSALLLEAAIGLGQQGGAVACHRFIGLNGEPVTEWEDGLPDSGKSFPGLCPSISSVQYAYFHPAEPVKVPAGWNGWCTQYPDRLPKLWGAREIAELNFYPEEGQRLFQVVEIAASPGADGEGKS